MSFLDMNVALDVTSPIHRWMPFCNLTFTYGENHQSRDDLPIYPSNMLTFHSYVEFPGCKSVNPILFIPSISSFSEENKFQTGTSEVCCFLFLLSSAIACLVQPAGVWAALWCADGLWSRDVAQRVRVGGSKPGAVLPVNSTEASLRCVWEWGVPPYQTSQYAKPKQTPKLKYPLSLAGSYQGPVAQDAILFDKTSCSMAQLFRKK